jgi:hypothetical protein
LPHALPWFIVGRCSSNSKDGFFTNDIEKWMKTGSTDTKTLVNWTRMEALFDELL